MPPFLTADDVSVQANGAWPGMLAPSRKAVPGATPRDLFPATVEAV